MHSIEQPWARSYQGLPLDGSPAARLRDETAQLLASGRAPRCPHGAAAIFWYLPAGMITCGSCAGDLAEAASAGPAACTSCGAPAHSVAVWATGGIACFAHLCERCGTSGVVPVMPN